MPEPINSDRLIIRQLQASDDQFIYQLLNSPGWLQYIGDRGVNDCEDAQRYIQNIRLGYDLQPLGLSAVVDSSAQQAIGLCGFLQRDYLPGPDIGYALLPSAEGKGYALEMTQAMINTYKKSNPTQILFAQVKPNNVRSIALLNKLGFSQSEKDYQLADTLVFQLKPD